MVTETYNSEQGSQIYGHWSQNLLVQNKLVRIIVTKTDASPRKKGGAKNAQIVPGQGTVLQCSVSLVLPEQCCPPKAGAEE